MTDIPLSKRGWAGITITVILSSIMTGFLSEFGADLYQSSKSMVIESQLQYSLLTIAVLVGIGIVTGVALVVYDIYKQKRKQDLKKAGFVRPTFSGLETNPDKIDPETKRKKEDDWKHFPANVK